MKHFIFTNRKVKNDMIVEDGHIQPSTEIRFASIDSEDNLIDVYPDISINELGCVDYSKEYDNDSGSYKAFEYIFEHLQDHDSELIIFIHGAGNKTKNIKKFNEKLHNQYVKNTNPKRRFLIFFWTTNGKKASPREYLLDAHDSIIAGWAFSKLFVRWTKYLEYKRGKINGKIHLMVQSMGNMVLKHAIDFLKMVDMESLSKWHFNETILTGADVETEIFEQGNAFNTLPYITDRVHVYGNKRDKALVFSSIVWQNQKGKLTKRLGQGYSKRQIAPDLDNVFAVDITEPTKGDFKDVLIEHNYFIEAPLVVKDIRVVLNGGRSRYLKN